MLTAAKARICALEKIMSEQQALLRKKEKEILSAVKRFSGNDAELRRYAQDNKALNAEAKAMRATIAQTRDIIADQDRVITALRARPPEVIVVPGYCPRCNPRVCR